MVISSSDFLYNTTTAIYSYTLLRYIFRGKLTNERMVHIKTNVFYSVHTYASVNKHPVNKCTSKCHCGEVMLQS